jgi:hypothetical protein
MSAIAFPRGLQVNAGVPERSMRDRVSVVTCHRRRTKIAILGSATSVCDILQRACLILATCHQVEGQARPAIPFCWFGLSGSITATRRWCTPQGALLPEDDRRNDGEDLLLAHQPPQCTHCGAG